MRRPAIYTARYKSQDNSAKSQQMDREEDEALADIHEGQQGGWWGVGREKHLQSA